MMYRLLVALVAAVISFAAHAVEVAPEHKRFIIDRADIRDSYAKRLCIRFQLCETTKFERSVALVVGISEYQHLKKLITTKDDAQKVKDFLFDIGEFDQVVFLTEADATKERIEYFMEDYFRQLLAETNGRTRFLFYFSGHGETISDGPKGSRGYLRLADNMPDSFSRSIGLDNVRAWADHNLSAAIHSLFIIDACVSGLLGQEYKGGIASVSADRDPRDLMRHRASFILTAGYAKQEALAGPKWGGSLFTWALLDSLKIGAADANPVDGIITSSELFDRVEGIVANQTNSQQTPKRVEVRKERSGDFFFLTPESRFRTVKVQARSSLLANPGADASETWKEVKGSTDVGTLQSFAEQYKGTSYSHAADQQIDNVLDEQTAQLADWQKWRYWRGRGLWNNGFTYCGEMTEFLRKTTEASNFKNADTGKSIEVAPAGGGPLPPAKIEGNFFIRADPLYGGRYCGIFSGNSGTMISCSRKITSNQAVYDSVYRKTLTDLRKCVQSQGWVEYTANDLSCNAEAVQEMKVCGNGFSRGPQSLWLRATREDDGNISLGVQAVIENRAKFKPVQGQYEFDPDGKLSVLGHNRTVRTSYDLERGVVDKVELINEKKKVFYDYDLTGVLKRVRQVEEQGSREWNLSLDKNGNLMEVRDKAGNAIISIAYNNVFNKPSRISVVGVGQLQIFYDLNGEISRLEPEKPDPKISSTVEPFLDLVSEIY